MSSCQVKNKRIEGTDIFVFNRLDNGNFTYSIPMPVEVARDIAGKVSGLQVANDGSLSHVSILRGISANRILMDQSNGAMWLPTIQEGFQLCDARLPFGRLIDFGLVLYNGEAPDQEIAQSLVAEANKNDYKLPILASFKSLGINQGGSRYGITPTIVSSDGLITGGEAVNALKRFIRKGDSGVRGLGRYVGGWGASWSDVLDDAIECCRVGRVSTEGSAQNLIDLVQTQVRTNYDERRANLEAQLSELNQQETLTIKSAESVLA